MSSRLLNFSLVLNLILLGLAGYWAGKNHSDGGSTPSSTGVISQTNRPVERQPEIASAAPVPLRWHEIESEDYPAYVANLRNAGCPEPVLRRIIDAELREFYARKAFALVQEFHRDFWEIAARENVREYFEKTHGQQVKALSLEPDVLLDQLLGEAAPELSRAPMTNAPDNRFADFLSPEKQEQLRQLAERYEARMRAVRQDNLASEERELQLAQLRREMENHQAAILSPQEWAEYQLRQSSAAMELRQLYGVDFSETELRNMAKTIDDYHRQTKNQGETDPAADSESLDQKLEAVLGPSRFADLDRARSASYRELYELATDFGQPGETAAFLFDLRLKSEMQADEILADKNRSTQEKQALLDEVQEQVEQAFLTKLGTGAYQSYKARNGRWINSLGKL